MLYQYIIEQYLLMDKVVSSKTFKIYGKDIYDDNNKEIIPYF